VFQNLTVKGETTPLPPTLPVPGKQQREVLGLLMQAIAPANLEIPEALLAQLPPDPGHNIEDLSGDDVFDQLRAARILAAMVLEPLFSPERAERMVALAARQPLTLSFPELVSTVLRHTWRAAAPATSEQRALLRVTQDVTLQSMMVLGAAHETSPEASDYVLEQLTQLAGELATRRDADPLTLAFYRQSARQITRYLEDPVARAPKSVSPQWGRGPRSRYPQPPGPPL
jgi:hypothetical protein